MLLFAYYLLKVIICSGILYGYYLLALRNKIFHGWNRFYLLSAIILSLVVPQIKINIFQNSGGPPQGVQLLQVVSMGDEFVYEYSKNKGFHIDATNLSVFIYTVVSIFLLGFLIQTLVRIAKLKKNNNQTIVEGVNFINTKAEGTPFSFFNDIFWNDKIDLNTTTGKQIFKHEVAHVQEKHSYDKIFINIVLIFFWCNPFFWLIRKELNIIHEFIADKKALEDSDTAAFAAMILQATYPLQRFTLTNNFFYSPLKRRLAMLTKNKNPRINYASRLLALPMAALIFFAFTVKMRTIGSTNYNTQQRLNGDMIQDTAIRSFKDERKRFLQQKISELKDNDPIKDYLIKRLSEIDTIPKMFYKNRKVIDLKVFKSEDKVIATYSDGTKETITKEEAEKRGFVLPPPPPSDSSYKGKDRGIEMANQKRLLSINDSIPKFYKGKKMKGAQGDKLNKTFIYYDDGSSDTIPTTEAEKLRIIPPPPAMVALDADKVFTKVEVEASFPGGDMAWVRYMKKVVETNINELTKENKSGTCRVRFIVHEDGSISHAEALTMKGTKLAEIAVNAVNKGPIWIPAKQNDRVVAAYREQPITFTIQDQ
jgi:hypothetical protein